MGELARVVGGDLEWVKLRQEAETVACSSKMSRVKYIVVEKFAVCVKILCPSKW